ncbi:MAG: class I SAM-dependent methyltransferase [Methylococcales bacterium]|nr:class I SAM-dependent methyltransferase [Methylococcales bacterium]
MNIEEKRYFQHVRTELITEIPTGDHRILEVGCAEGATSASLKNSGCASVVVGIELIPEAADQAKNKLDHVVCGDIESLALQEPWFSEESFDYILCGDVLEHLKDPWKQITNLLKLLKRGGKIIISLPNVRYYGVSFPLIFRDEWTYREAGILDLTHFRFFTKSTGVDMLTKGGLVNVDCAPLFNRRRDKVFSIGSLGLLTGLVSPQWRFTGTKKT